MFQYGLIRYWDNTANVIQRRYGYRYSLTLLRVYLLTDVIVVLSIRLLSVLRGHSVFSSPPQRLITSDFDVFLYQILSIILFSYLNS